MQLHRPRLVAPAQALLCALGLLIFGTACITRQPPTDTQSSITAPSAVPGATGSRDDRSGRPATTTTTPSPGTTTPTPVTPPSNVAVAYQQDLKPVFDADCVRCHSGSRPDGNYAMTTYAQVMRAVAAGNPTSVLIRFTQRGGSMYRYWSGNAQAKADLVRAWIVNNAAAESR